MYRIHMVDNFTYVLIWYAIMNSKSTDNAGWIIDNDICIPYYIIL